MRIKFKERKQKEFLKEVLVSINCPSLRELRKRGFDIPYSTLKNYFNEDRTLPLEFFEQLLEISGLKKERLIFKIVKDNVGQIEGGKKSRK
jgi:hypothetical protein